MSETPKPDPISDLAHIVTGSIAANCCHRTGGRDPSAKACDCRAIAEQLIDNGDEVIAVIQRALG